MKNSSGANSSKKHRNSEVMAFQGIHSGELQKMEVRNISVDAGTVYIPSTGRSVSRTLQLLPAQMKERVAYDANGNIQKYLRKSIQGGNMDSLNYRYYANTNRLKYITDNVASNGYDGGPDHLIVDIDGQTDSNYVYDAIGNLVSDKAEKITSIKWNVYGKIQEITRTATSSVPTTNIKYTYDASGNRISQIVTSGDTKHYTWYVRDAQGNILSTYTADGNNTDLSALDLDQAENVLYGSSRLGTVAVGEGMTGGPDNTEFYYEDRSFFYERGHKQYELTNHLGNVLATISDRKFGVSSGGSSLIDYYEPDIVTAQDYYPFGMMSRVALPNNDVPYKFGFNGKMNDNDVKGGYGLQQDYGMRIYDGRVGRFLSVDPLTKSYPELTPYQFASNRPIDGIDLDGGEWKPLTDYFADKAKANGYPRLSGFIRTLGAGDVQTQTQDAIKNVAKGKIAEVAVQVYGYTSTGMFENSVKLAKKAIIDRDPEAQGEALGMLAQGAFGEVVARARPTAPRVVEEPVTATNTQTTAANSGNAAAAEANTVNVKKPFSNEYQGMEFLDDNQRMVDQPYNPKKTPAPSPKFKTPTNSAQNPISIVPEGYNLRIMKPTQQYPNGYWVLEKPMPQGGFQKVNPSTMKPGPQHDTHVPLPEGYWNKK